MFFPYYTEFEEHERQRWPVATLLLLAAMLGVHGWLELTQEGLGLVEIYYRFGVCRFDWHWYQPLTCTLIHGSWLHVLGNAWFLWIYGAALERLLGWWRLLGLYLIGAYGSIAIHLLTLAPLFADTPCVGASGAISALLGAFLILMPGAKLRTMVFSPLSFRPVFFTVPAWAVLSLWLAGQLLFSLEILGETRGVAFWAHVGGFVIGAALGQGLKCLTMRALQRWDEGLREPLVAAWNAYCQGDPALAAGRLAELPAETAAPGSNGAQALLVALLPGGEGSLSDRFQRAFAQARDYDDPARLLTVYLQSTARLPAALLPVELHRTAALVAARLGHPELACLAWRRVLEAGEAPDERLLRALESLLGKQLQQPELAARVAAWRGGD